MGQQQTEMGSSVRRMFLVLMMAALMAAMLAASAIPAFASSTMHDCIDSNVNTDVNPLTHKYAAKFCKQNT